MSPASEDAIFPEELKYVFKAGGATEVESGTIRLSDDQTVLTSDFMGPNTMLLEISWEIDGVEHRVFAGAVAAPEQIEPAMEAPADFDAFWAGKIAELESAPAKPQLRSKAADREDVYYWYIEMDGFRESKIRGQIARPKSGQAFPALLRVQWAGVYGLQQDWVTHRAEQGWLARNILPHDLPIDESDEFYAE